MILIIEALLIAIVSAVLGIIMGYLIAASLLPDVAHLTRTLWRTDTIKFDFAGRLVAFQGLGWLCLVPPSHSQIGFGN